METQKISAYSEKEANIMYETIEKLNKRKSNLLKSPNIVNIINIVEEFIKDNKLICYGGMAINNILPPNKQFYNKDLEFPDYDFFSSNAYEDAKKLADVYYKKGFDNVEAKSGMHEGTYKVYVNFLPVADITQMHNIFFKNLKKTAINVNDILYCPPNFLRMSMYLELSRPLGDITRWEKVFYRLQLLNKEYPLDKLNKNKCNNLTLHNNKYNKTNNNTYEKIRDTLIENKVLFFGGYASFFYSTYLKKNKKLKNIFNFDVFHNDPLKCCQSINDKFDDNKFNLVYKKFNSIGELIPMHYKVYVNDTLYATIFKPNACYSYNIHTINKKKIKIATIYTMLSMYLTYLFINNDEYDKDKILCMAELIYEIYLKNKTKNKGILKTFSVKCYGKQEDFSDILEEKNKKYEEFKKNKNSEDFKKLFLKYNPASKNEKKGGGKTDTNMVLYYFYFDECPYCQEFNKTWENKVINCKKLKHIQKKKIHKNDKLTTDMNVSTFPTLILHDGVTNHNYSDTYDERNLKNIVKFVTNIK